MKSGFFLLVLILLSTIGLAQSQDNGVTKWLTEWQMDPGVYKKMKRKSVLEFEFTPSEMQINGRPAIAKSLHTRGKSTKMFWRKSYTVSLKKDFAFPTGSDSLRMEKFYLLSMSMDRNYFCNRLAFSCLDKLGLFPLWYHYSELKINNETEGLYLVVQRPADYLMKEKKAQSVLRRLSSSIISKEKYVADISTSYQEQSQETFNAITHACSEFKGEKLYEALDKVIDGAAFQFLVINYIANTIPDQYFYQCSALINKHISISIHRILVKLIVDYAT